MKKFSALALALIFISFGTPAHAATEVRLIATPHRLFDGTFRNDELYQMILPEGKLGTLVFSTSRIDRTWVIDPELIDEIADMSDGYEIVNGVEAQGVEAAQKFMTELRVMASRGRVIALAYGNPDTRIANQLAPSELKFYYSYGQNFLAQELGRAVESGQGWEMGKSFASYTQRSLYTQHRKALARLSLVVPASELEALRVKLAILLSPKLNKYDRDYFYFRAAKAVEKTQSQLRISSGKYQLTSTNSTAPMTLVNEFSVPVTVSLRLVPTSSRLSISTIESVTVEAKSRLQLSVPVTVYAPGRTTVIATLTNERNQPVNESAELTFNATIIDTRVTWFTTAAGILLLIAGVTQSVRRVRKARHEVS